MKISYSDDTRRGAGHGILTCRDADFPAGAWSMALLRASDQASLATDGNGGSHWTGETRFLPVETEPAPGGGRAVLLGPEVVDALDPQEQYLVTLRQEQGEPLKARLQVRGVTYSPDGALDNTGARAAAPAPEAAPQPHAPAPPVPEPAAPETVEMPLAPDPETPRAARRPSPVLVAVLTAVLLAGGLGAWKFFDARAREEAAVLSGGEAAPAPSGGNGAAGSSLPATPKTAEEQVRAFFSGPDITAAAALKLAAELPKGTPAEQDAVYRLYYFAAENEAPGAFLPYAACLDPAAPQWGSIDKDAAAAYAAYAKAAASDAKAAKAALEAQTRLRAWLDREAAAGNARARAWLQELP
ncbi:hypothetical protein [uncultured Desulfovibrio sp.]|uniref:hypothetical protein n=1 Tax=uncultured Desulfovibrio sp. TaxID=167968 RepID=UPI00260A2D58|nr:hypothetical protein [uncultured Desulfovibrio sp.]